MPLNNTRHNLLAQRRLTRDLGEYVTLYRVTPCSCSGGTDHADPSCKLCQGGGRVYGDVQRVKGLIASIDRRDKALLQSGLAMPGDLTFSPDVRSDTAINDYDLVRLDYGQIYEGDVLKRGSADRLRYQPTEILSITQHDPASGVATSYEPPAYKLTGHTLTWYDGPPIGAGYTVRYMARFDWIVYPGVSNQRVMRGQSLGQRVLLRKRHVAGLPAPTLVVNGTVAEWNGYATGQDWPFTYSNVAASEWNGYATGQEWPFTYSDD